MAISTARAMQMFIGGEQTDSVSGQVMELRNPANGELVGQVPKGNAEDVERAVEAASKAFPQWSAMPAGKRAELMIQAADKVREHVDEIAELLTFEQGKTIKESQIETRRLADNLVWFAGLAEKIRGDYVTLNEPGKYGMVIRKPIGVVGAIVPWNFPLTLMANKICPALAAGNTVIVKPASTTPMSSVRCIEAINSAGLPPGVLNIVTGPGSVVGERIITHPKIRKIGFTGETGTGMHVMEAAAKELKHITLELGGSDPMIVCDDANLDAAASAASVGRFFNCGQACLAVKRLYVFESVYDQFMEKFLAKVERLKVGPGTDPATRMGPMHTANGVREMEEYVEDALKGGAKLTIGGRRPEGAEYGNGTYYLPTVLENVAEGARAWKEETFGPVLPVARVKDVDEGIARANDSEFGLGSSIWTTDVRKSRMAAERIEAGYTWVNSLQVAYDELPFGGTKHSGFGKEHGTEALEYYTEQKSIVVGAG